jgi:hypothetical protein
MEMSYYEKAEAQIAQLRADLDASRGEVERLKDALHDRNNALAWALWEDERDKHVATTAALDAERATREATERAMDEQAQALVVEIEAREKAEAERDEALKSRDGMHAAMCDQVDRAERLEAALVRIRDHYDDTDLAAKHMAAIARAALASPVQGEGAWMPKSGDRIEVIQEGRWGPAEVDWTDPVGDVFSYRFLPAADWPRGGGLIDKHHPGAWRRPAPTSSKEGG